MSCFIDTSAFYALLDADDSSCKTASARWSSLVNNGVQLVTSNYVLLEVFALLQNRLGVGAVRSFQDDVVPLLAIEWISAELHEKAMSALLSSGRKGLSLVDCSSFEVMRKLGMREAFTYDRHFREQGFRIT